MIWHSSAPLQTAAFGAAPRLSEPRRLAQPRSAPNRGAWHSSAPLQTAALGAAPPLSEPRRLAQPRPAPDRGAWRSPARLEFVDGKNSLEFQYFF